MQLFRQKKVISDRRSQIQEGMVSKDSEQCSPLYEAKIKLSYGLKIEIELKSMKIEYKMKGD